VPTSPAHQAGGAAWSETDCLNPTGLDFAGVAFYTPFVPPPVNHGCTIGFWKNTNKHPWPSPYNPNTSTIGGAPPANAGFTNSGQANTLMFDALSFPGGPDIQDAKNLLLKQAVGALLNAATPGMGYPLTTTQIRTEVNAALASGDRDTILNEASKLEGFNSLEGPLC